MGTVFTLDVRDEGDWTAAMQDVVDWLHFVDATFSTYRPDSEICRLARGELIAAEAHPTVGEVLDRCAEAWRLTDGFFNAMAHGRLDPSGLVKGWAIEQASRRLRLAGACNHIVSGGGDMQIAGHAGPGRPWIVGIADPADPASVLARIAVTDAAVATSGTAERGAHIVNPFTGAAAVELASVTVVGPALTDVDVMATAAFAMGHAGVEWLQRQRGIEGLAVDAAGRRHCTSGWSTWERLAHEA